MKPKAGQSAPSLLQLTGRLLIRQPVGRVTITPATTTLGVRGRDEARLEVDPAVLKTVQSGVHVLRVSLDGTALSETTCRQRLRLVDEVRIGIRQLETRTDYL